MAEYVVYLVSNFLATQSDCTIASVGFLILVVIMLLNTKLLFNCYKTISTNLHFLPLCYVRFRMTRAGLKLMQPMQLHWPRASEGPVPWCLGKLFIFSRYSFHSRI